MRKIISNTTPILSLLKINKISLLENLYEKIIFQLQFLKKSKKAKENHII